MWSDSYLDDGFYTESNDWWRNCKVSCTMASSCKTRICQKSFSWNRQKMGLHFMWGNNFKQKYCVNCSSSSTYLLQSSQWNICFYRCYRHCWWCKVSNSSPNQSYTLTFFLPTRWSNIKWQSRFLIAFGEFILFNKALESNWFLSLGQKEL